MGGRVRRHISDIEKIRLWLRMYEDGRITYPEIKAFLSSMFGGRYYVKV